MGTHRSRFAAVAAIALLATSCSETGRPREAAPVPSATPSVGEFESGAELPPGEYHSYGPFRPRLQFRLDDRWTADHAVGEFFDFHRGDLFVAFAAPTKVAGRRGLVRVGADMTPSAFMRSLLSHPRVTGAPAGRTRVDGQEVALFDLTASDGSQLFGGPEGEFAGVASQHYRLGALRVDDAMVVVMAFTEKPSRDAFRPAEDVWETVRFLD